MKVFDSGAFQRKMQMPSHDKYFIQMYFGVFHGTPTVKTAQMNLLGVHEFVTKVRR